MKRTSHMISNFIIAFTLMIMPMHRSCLQARVGGAEKGMYGGDPPVLADLDLEAHDVNAVYLMVSNQGPIGLNLRTYNGTGIFPSNTANNYLYGTGLWFGAQYDNDNDGETDKVFTMAYNLQAGDSEFREGTNDQNPGDPLTRVFKSTDPDDLTEWPERFRVVDLGKGDLQPRVISNQDFVTTYTTKDKISAFNDISMPIEIDQRSMALRGGLAGQAVIFIFDIHHWGEDIMQDAWVGYISDMDVGNDFNDDLASFIRDWVTLEGDTIPIDMGYAWDSDFAAANFTGDPGFVGISYLQSPGNPADGIDNDGDDLIDESPFNGIDDDADGQVDETDEVDELGLINFSIVCRLAHPCEGPYDPNTDQQGYDALSCISDENPDSSSGTICHESTSPVDIRFMISSGPFDWYPGQTQRISMTMVFAHPTGDRDLPFIGDPPRPDANDDDLIELLAVKQTIQRLFDLNFKLAEPPVPPVLSLVPGNRQVTHMWDDLSLHTPDPDFMAFVEIDSTYREYDFQGFRIWRSRTGEFSRLGDPDDPDWPLTPEAIQQNNDVPGLDLTLLAQYDLVDGITTDSLGTTCYDSIIQVDSTAVYTECDTFNLGNDTGIRYSYVDRGDSLTPLTNGFRYYYAVTAYDYNSDELPVSRLSLDSGLSFSTENSAVPRSHASSFVDAFAQIDHIDSIGIVLDDTSSIFVQSETGALDPPDAIHASNALVDFSFSPLIPENISDDHYTLVLDDFERVDRITNRISYHVDDATGERLITGITSTFILSYDGSDQTLGVSVFDPVDSSEVIFLSDLSFQVNAEEWFAPDSITHLLAVNDSGEDILDSLGVVTISGANMILAGFRGCDIQMEWIAVDEVGDSLTLEVRDLDNLVDVPFGYGIVTEHSQIIESEKGSNWSFLPVGGGALQNGGRYFETTASAPIADLWISGVRIVVQEMSRMPLAGDVWTLRQVIMTVEIDTTMMPPETTYIDARRPPVPGTRYRIDTQSGGPDVGEVDLSVIRVVPNPYLASASWDIGPSQRRLEFVNLPPECTIRIYTISGILVRTLEHTQDEGGTEVYDILTREGLPLASGNYYYHVTTPDAKTHLGRFAVVQ